MDSPNNNVTFSSSGDITISGNITASPMDFEYKFNEDEIISHTLDYIKNTYKEHYSGKDGIQTVEYIMANCDNYDFVKGNAIKYCSRFGKKNGYSEKDIYKAIHYMIMMYYFVFIRDNKNANQ